MGLISSHSSSDVQEGNRNLIPLKWKEFKAENTEIIDLKFPYCHFRGAVSPLSLTLTPLGVFL